MNKDCWQDVYGGIHRTWASYKCRACKTRFTDYRDTIQATNRMCYTCTELIPVRAFPTRPCQDCGHLYVKNRSSPSYRCPPCAKRHNKARVTAYRQARRGMYRNSHKARAKFYGVDWEPIAPLDIFTRDQFTCYLCGQNTDHSAPVNSARYPTLDHIIPMSRGGHHTIDNVATACFICNARKGNREEVSA